MPFLLTCLIVCGSATAPGLTAIASSTSSSVRGIFVDTLDNKDFPSRSGLSSKEIKAEITEIVALVRKGGYNAIFFEARPQGDSLYSSRIFPKSDFLTKKQGDFSFIDPLKLLIKEAKKSQVDIYAVIDPYYIGDDLSSLHKSNPGAKNPGLVLNIGDSYYLNPTDAKTAELNVDDVKAMVKKYDLAGVLIDGVDLPALKNQSGYGTSVSKLIGTLSSAISSAKKDTVLGVVLSGSTQSSVLSLELSAISKSAGLLIPRISAAVGYDEDSYQKILAAWISAAGGADKLCPVSSAASILSPSSDGVFIKSSNELLFQQYINEQTGISKSAISGYSYLKTGYFDLLEKLSSFSNHTASSAPKINLDYPRTLSITRPTADLTTTYSSYYIMGTSNPDVPLTIDGETIERTSTTGLFGAYVNLSVGENTFTFTQGAQSKVVSITRKTGSTPVTISTITVMSPASSTSVKKGGELTLTCTAPAGSSVSASFLGKSVTLTQQSPANASVAATFKGKLKVPSISPDGEVTNLGPVSYTLTRNGITTSYTSKGNVYYVGTNATLAVQVSDYISSVPYDYTINGVFKATLRQGACDFVKSEVGEYYELASGGYIMKSTVQVLTGKAAVTKTASSMITAHNDKNEGYLIKGATGLTYTASERDDGIDITLYNLTGLPKSMPLTSTVFSSISCREEGGNTIISFTTANGKPVWGYDIGYSGEDTQIYFKKSPVISNSFGRPLEGVTVVLDPGHGGTDPGALGTAGLSGPAEKDLNLATAYVIKTQLEQMGASVTLTRTGDEAVSLFDRMLTADKVRPDFFLSVHHNSVGENANASKPVGIEAYYHNSNGSLFAKKLTNDVSTDMNSLNRGFFDSYYVVTKTSQAPAVLLELGFMPNPLEYERLSSSLEMFRIACGVSSAIVETIRGY